jgi:hypothetical protein
MVEDIVGGLVEEGVRRWLWETCRGNALYVRELVLGALDSGALNEVSGLWRMASRPPLSSSLTELISARLTALAGPERRLLELLALGEPLSLASLLELAGRDPLVAAEERGLVEIEGPPGRQQARLAHPLYGEAIRTSLPSLRARAHRLALADSLQAQRGLSAEDSLRVARWSLDARAPIPNPVLIDAARAANVIGDPNLGAQLAALAVRAGAAGAAALLLARSHQIRKRFADAESVLARLEGDIESPDTAIAYLEQRVAVLYWGLRRPDDARALLARAQDWWVDRSWLRRLAPVRLQLAALLDGQAGAAAVAGEILADDSLQEGVRRQLEPVYAASLFYSGRVFEAYEVARRIRPALPLSNHTEELALIAFSMISFESGQDLRGLEREMAEIFEEGVRIGDDAAAGVAAAALSGIAFLAGRYRDAKRWLGEAELHRERHDTFGALLITWATRVGVAHFSGDDDGAAVALARCEDALQGRDPLPNQLPYIVRARLGRRRRWRQSRRAAPLAGRRGLGCRQAAVRRAAALRGDALWHAAGRGRRVPRQIGRALRCPACDGLRRARGGARVS